MRNRKPMTKKVISASAEGIVRHTSPTMFREGKIKAYLNQLNINVREYTKLAEIRLEMRMLDKGLITI